MNNPKLIFAAVIGVVFCFAGYNLWSYFKEQQAIQIEEDRVAEERKIAREAERKRRKEEQAAAAEAERLAIEERRAADEAERLAEKQKIEEDRLAALAEREELRKAVKAEQAAKEARRLVERVQNARTLKTIRELGGGFADGLSKLSPRYVKDKPEEFLGKTFTARNLGVRQGRERVIYDETDPLMLYAAFDNRVPILEALLEIGMDVNAQNKAGFTPLMFAAAYGSPEAIQFFIDQGADPNATAYVMDLNALHLAALLNPNPDVIDVLLTAGLSIEGTTQNGYTPIILAASDNQNFEVAERLAALGADRTAYDQDGKTAKALIEDRINNNGDIYVMISKEVNQRILEALAP